MNKNIDDRRVRKTKKALRQGFATLLEKKNIKDISVRELTDLVDLHRGTFYLHYRDIYDLYEQIQNEIIQEVVEIIEEYAPKELENSSLPIMLALIEYLADNAKISQVMLSNNGDMTFIERLSDVISKKCFSDWLKLFNFNNAESSEFVGAYLVSGCIGVFRKWLENGMTQSPTQLAELIGGLAKQSVKYLLTEQPAL